MTAGRRLTKPTTKLDKKADEADFLQCIDTLRASAHNLKFTELAEMLDQVACEAALKSVSLKAHKTVV